MADLIITCRTCAAVFVFTGAEQEFFAQRSQETGKPWPAPKACRDCRQKAKAARDGGFNSRGGYSATSAPAPAAYSVPSVEYTPAPDDDRPRGRKRRRQRDMDYDE